jgi:peptidoglycan/LPS O-acetylase OafA/YrhL
MSVPVPHRQSIDLARFVASFGVVWAHAHGTPDDWVGHLSLGLFLVLTAFLAGQSAQRAGGAYPFLRRAQRILLPWLAWSAFYRMLDLYVSDRPDRFVLLSDPWSLLYGSVIHLWFLPFVALAMSAVGPVVRRVRSPAGLAVAVAVLLAMSLPLLALHSAGRLVAPFAQWSFAVPLYGLGLLLAVAQPMERGWWLTVASLIMTVFSLGLVAPILWPWTIAASVLVFGLFWRLPLRGRLLPALGQAAFGIYLSHLFFLLVSYKLLGTAASPAILSVTTFLMAWAGTVLLRRIPVMQRLL